MKSQNKIFLLLLSLLLITFSCKKESTQKSDLEIVRNNNNIKSYPVTKMDSVQAITSITKQKIGPMINVLFINDMISRFI